MIMSAQPNQELGKNPQEEHLKVENPWCSNNHGTTRQRHTNISLTHVSKTPTRLQGLDFHATMPSMALAAKHASCGQKGRVLHDLQKCTT
jgi:organic hydroperoxide reductase OsmC/OhrA